MRRLHTDRNRLGVELLEARDNPAGNVSAVLSNGAIYLTGDALGNELSIAPNAAGELTITGLNGTTVNGQESISVRAGAQVSYISARLGDGNDSISISNVTTSSGIAVDGGNGNDAVTLSNVSTGSVSVGGGAGDDSVTFNTVSASFGVKVMGGTGTDTFTNNGTTTPNLFASEFEQPAS
jgi:hypothetical protein